MYEGARVTYTEAELLILNYTIRHSISDVGLEDLLSTINKLLPLNIFPSKYRFLKNYKTPNDFIIRYYCPNCCSLLEDEKNLIILKCKSCNEEHDKKILHRILKSYFLQIPLRAQIEDFVNSEKYDLICKNNNENDDYVSNITSGRYYTNLKKNKIIDHHDLTLQFNSDGVKLFKSSSLSLWPIQVGINELPYLDRRKQMMLTGLWYGKDKPVMNTYLKPFTDELIDLHENGVIRHVGGASINIKIHTITCPVDSVARPAIINSKQFNGKYGCSFCYHEGETAIVGNGFTRVYPGGIAKLRTVEEHYDHAKNAEELEIPIMEVKGFSIISLIPCFSIIDSFIPDYMHCLLLGVVKTFVDAWLNSSFSGNPWYIGTAITNVEARLLTIEPPCELTRTPRKLSDRKLWKAHEWKNFLCYYSLLCLEEYLPKKYLNHWFLLVYGIRIMLQPRISPNELKKASEIIVRFVLLIEPLYGKEFCKFNCHLLLHFQRAITLFGPLWDTSTFPAEHYNSVLARMFQNSQSIPEQISKNYNRFRRIEHESLYTFRNPACPEEIKDLYVKLLGNLKVSEMSIKEGESLRIFGAFQYHKLSMIEQNVIEELLQEPINEVTKLYNRFIYENVLWHGYDKNELEKRRNSSALLVNGKIILVKHIALVTTIQEEEKYVILGNVYEEIEKSSCIAKDHVVRIYSDEIFKICRITTTILACYLSDIQEKMICMAYPEGYCVTTLVNNIEKD